MQQGNVPVVVSVEGDALRTLASCPGWCDSYEKARRRRRIEERAGLIPTTTHSDSERIRYSRSVPGVRATKKATVPRYIDPSDFSSSSDSEDEPYKQRAKKKRSYTSGSESEDSSRQARKRTKNSREKGSKQVHHHKKSKRRSKRDHDGKSGSSSQYTH